MGLTVHYSLASKVKSADKALSLVQQVRQLALDLPFQEVDEIQIVNDPSILNATIDDARNGGSWVGAMSAMRVPIPWTKLIYEYPGGSTTQQQRSKEVRPSHIISFNTIPAEGCETAQFGLALYPFEVEVDYFPQDDRKFKKLLLSRDRHRNVTNADWVFDLAKFEKSLPPNLRYTYEDRKVTKRRLKTNFGGWRMNDFCKTQYASDPKCGGVANFIAGHISLITLIDRAAKIPGLIVDYDDEGKYGQSNYTDDWKVKNPVYYKHEGKYNAAALVKEVGEWNHMIAGIAGAMRDAMGARGLDLESPIFEYQDFEKMEFKGSQDENIKPFLEIMRTLAAKHAAANVS